MKLIELTDAKGASVWVNPERLLWAGPPDRVPSSMYGDGGGRACTRLHFGHGEHLEVREAPDPVVARLTADRLAA